MQNCNYWEKENKWGEYYHCPDWQFLAVSRLLYRTKDPQREHKDFAELRKQRLEVNKVVQFSSVAQSCPTLPNPMNCSIPGLPIHHQLPESTQTHVHWVGDAIQPSYPLSSPSPPALNLSQHQGLFRWVSSSHQVAKVLEFQLQHKSFHGLIGSPCSPRDSQESSPMPSSKASILCSAVFIVQLLHPYTTTGKTIALTRWTFVGKVISLLFNMLSSLVIDFLPRRKRL